MRTLLGIISIALVLVGAGLVVYGFGLAAFQTARIPSLIHLLLIGVCGRVLFEVGRWLLERVDTYL